MSFENNTWGQNKAVDAEYGGDAFAPTPEQAAAADKILEGSELENATIGDEEQDTQAPNWPPQN